MIGRAGFSKVEAIKAHPGHARGDVFFLQHHAALRAKDNKLVKILEHNWLPPGPPEDKGLEAMETKSVPAGDEKDSPRARGKRRGRR